MFSERVRLVFKTKFNDMVLHETEVWMTGLPALHDVCSFRDITAAPRVQDAPFEVVEIKREFRLDYGIDPPSHVPTITIYLKER